MKMDQEYSIFSDGGARGNPGPAGIGAVISDDSGNLLAEISEYIGNGTNNQAEYKALIAALAKASEMRLERVTCHLDSELVVKQLRGEYKIREAGLQLLANEVLKLIKDFESVRFKHVPREKNRLADRLVNEALDKAGF